MQDKRILEETLCLGTGVVESVRKEIDGTIVASCRPRKVEHHLPPLRRGTASTTARRPQEVEDDGPGPRDGLRRLIC